MSIIEQKDIDELLNVAMTDNKDDDPENSENEERGVTEKIYRETKSPIQKITDNYVSPVIRQENILYNPESDVEDDNNKVVVRSLDNYIKFINGKNSGEYLHH